MELNKNTKTYKLGVFGGIFTGASWGLHSVLTAMVMVLGGFITLSYEIIRKKY